MMSSEPQPRRTAEKRRFSSTAVQAIHQRRRWAVARVGAMARRGEARRPGSGSGSGSAAACAQTSASAPGTMQPGRPTRAAAAARGACHPSAAREASARSKEAPALPVPWATLSAAGSSACPQLQESRPGQTGRLLPRLTRRETEARKQEGTNACSGTWT